MSDNTSYKLIIAFVTLILGAVLIGTVATQALSVTDKKGILDETIDLVSARNSTNGGIINGANITIANPPTTWKVEDCPIADFVLKNGSSATLVEATDYEFSTTTGVIQLYDTGDVNGSSTNTSYADYVYCGDDYMNIGWGRSTTNLVPGFFGIALLLISVGLFFSIAKDYGMI